MADLGDPAAETTTPGDEAPNPNEKLVKAFDSEQESEAMVVKGLLDSAGIENNLTSAALVQDMFPGLGGMIILVREEDEQRARELIAASTQEVPADRDQDETAEIKAFQEPPAQA